MHILNFIRMWLFDDILKKPTPPTGQANPASDPLMGSGTSGAQAGQAQWSGGTTPVIVKSESSTVFWPNSEADSIRSQNALPSVPTVHAEEDSSSVLMSPNAASTPIAPVAPVEEPMVVTPVAESAPAPVAAAPVSVTPPATPPAPVQSAPTEVAPLAQAPVEHDVLQIPTWPSLFDHIMREDEPVAPAAPAAPVATAQALPAQEIPAVPATEPVWLTSSNPTPQNVSTETAVPVTWTNAPPTELSPSSAMTMPVASNYATPREFIEKSIDNLDVMLETIDDRHTAKMTEAEWYRMEKMRFAELEKNAYAEAEIMDRERDHTVRMKSIFEKELETDEANRNKKTVAHTELHAEKHVHAHKRHVHEDEEELIAAS